MTLYERGFESHHYLQYGQIAQSAVERWSEEPSVRGSIPFLPAIIREGVYIPSLFILTFFKIYDIIYIER